MRGINESNAQQPKVYTALPFSALPYELPQLRLKYCCPTAVLHTE